MRNLLSLSCALNTSAKNFRKQMGQGTQSTLYVYWADLCSPRKGESYEVNFCCYFGKFGHLSKKIICFRPLLFLTRYRIFLISII